MSVYEISVEHTFTASHAVALSSGAYEPQHSHAWHVTATFRSEKLDDTGMVLDFLHVSRLLKEVTADLEGGYLNAVPQFFDCGVSAEAVAHLLATRLSARINGLYRLAVIEAPGCTAAYYPGTA